MLRTRKERYIKCLLPINNLLMDFLFVDETYKGEQ